MIRGNKIKTIKAAIVPYPQKDKLVSVYKFFPKRGWSDVDTLDKATAEYLKNNGRGDYVISSVSTIDINSLLETLPKVDFLNIDIEGLDTEIAFWAETENPTTLMIVEAITMQTPDGEAKMRFADSWVLNDEGRIQIHFAGMTQYPDGSVA